MLSNDFGPGFRLSVTDGMVLAVGLGLVAMLLSTIPWGAFVVAFVVMHFFLFCNVFRLSRSLELFWSAVFLLLSAGTILWSVPGWGMTATISLLVTLLVVAVEMRKPSYHGIGWRRINPELPTWWQLQVNRKPDLRKARSNTHSTLENDHSAT